MGEVTKNTWWGNFVRELKIHKHLYLFLLPTFLMIFTFRYYPMVSGIYHSFFEWNGSTVNEFIGIKNYLELFNDSVLWLAFKHTFILLAANILKMVPSIITAIVMFRLKGAGVRYFYRVLCVVPMIVPGMVVLLLWQFIYEPNVGFLNTALEALGAGTKPNWLADPDLALLAIIFMGFPWFGVVSVLILLSGLEGISQDVFEAAEIDGITPWGRFLYIEFPLILPQIRILLTLLIIGTFRAYNNILVLTDGGPSNSTIVPALHMFHKAFVFREAGYACAVGVFLFLFITVISYFANKYLRVSK